MVGMISFVLVDLSLKELLGQSGTKTGLSKTRFRFFPELHPIISLFCGQQPVFLGQSAQRWGAGLYSFRPY